MAARRASARWGWAASTSSGALSTENDPPEKASRPFDAKRDGFVPAEGAAVLVLESLEHAIDRSADIVAEVAGYGVSSDAFHAVQPDEDGAGAARAIRLALEDAGVAPSDVSYVNAHGTSTPKNDLVETLAIKTVFQDHAYRVPISSSKSMIGHTLGGAGALEAVACVESIRHNQVHPTINYEFPDPDCDLDYVPNVSRSLPVDTVLSNSFGFGGQNACLVFAASPSRPSPRTPTLLTAPPPTGPISSVRLRKVQNRFRWSYRGGRQRERPRVLGVSLFWGPSF